MYKRQIEISLAVGLLCALVWCALEPGFLMSWWGAAFEPLCDGVLTAEGEGSEVVLFASDGRALLFPPEAVSLKASRTTQGVAVMALKKKAVVTQAQFAPDTLIRNHARYRARSLPAAGALLREDDRGEEQMSLI